MPIYGYSCKSCEHTFDALQKMSDPVLVDCPECGESSLRKQLSAPKFRLKGEGWYETDFKTGDKKNLSGDSDGGEKPKDGKAKESDSKGSEADKKTEKKKDTATGNKKPSSDSNAETA